MPELNAILRANKKLKVEKDLKSQHVSVMCSLALSGLHSTKKLNDTVKQVLRNRNTPWKNATRIQVGKTIKN